MHAKRLVILLALAITPWGAYGTNDDFNRLREDARKVAGQLLQHIRSELVREMERTGPIRSVIVCKYSVPELTSALSRQTGARVTRVSLRPRNPSLGAADPWEQSVLADFDKRVARGEKAEGLEHAEVVSEPQGKFFRYMRAIPMQPACSGCHGPVDGLSEGVKAQLAIEYPHDRAIGFLPGQVRGAVVYKKPL
jgi:hypothetical protein